MYVAYDSKDEVFNALDSEVEKNKEYHCPICGGKVIFKKGVKIQSHFAHAKNCSCEFETYKKESSEQKNIVMWKSNIFLKQGKITIYK